MIKFLTELNGVSGCEHNVREALKAEIMSYCDEIKIDKMGNLAVLKKGRDSTKKLMISAHMDEVGFIVKNITDDGYIKFAAVGGIDSRILLGLRVSVGEKNIPGVIGVKAVHMTTAEERGKNVKITDMYIDIGAESKEEAEWLVQKGDYIAFDSKYIKFGTHKVKAKALDDRAGCAALINLIKTANFKYDTWCVFTVQEETGLRGAAVAANCILPNAALVIEGTTCSDDFRTPEKDKVTVQGAGCALSVMERTSRSDTVFVSDIIKLADKHGVKWQFKRTGAGGNDAGAIQIAGIGVRTAVISIPCRYIHSPAGVMDERDYDSAEKLIKIVSEEISIL